MNIDGHMNAAARQSSRLQETVYDLMARIEDLKQGKAQAIESEGEEVLFLCDEAQSEVARVRTHVEEATSQMKETGVIS